MKIESDSSIPAAAGDRAQRNPASRSGNGVENPGSGVSAASGDRLSLTDMAQQMRELESKIQGQPRVDRQRVEAVKEALNNGTFSINPERIAERLIGLEQALDNKR